MTIGGIILTDKTDLARIINSAAHLAVATLTTDGQAPDVRVVLGAYDSATAQVIFVSSPQAEKVAEIAAHAQAAFATAPVGQGEFVRVRQAIVQSIPASSAPAAVYNQKFPQSGQYAAAATYFALSFQQAEVTTGGTTTTIQVEA